MVIETFHITELGHRGDGVAHKDGQPVYIPFTLPDEVITAERGNRPDRARLVHVDTSSPQRIASFCPHFGVCGGCAFQHWDEAAYKAWKYQQVVGAVSHICSSFPNLSLRGGAKLRRSNPEPETECVSGLLRYARNDENVDTTIHPLIDAHGAGRRRVVFHARRGQRGSLSVGFAGLRSHDIVAIDHCPVLDPTFDGGLAAAWDIAEALAKIEKPLDIHITATLAGMDVDVRGSGPLKPQQIEALAALTNTHNIARLTRHGELVVQHRAPVVQMGRAMVPIPPAAFLQATTVGEETLARLVLEAVDEAKKVADLFCGVGPFALRLAERAEVLAADSDAPAIAALTQAAKTERLKPITTHVRDLFRRPLMAEELKGLDAVVFDPPRQGGEAQARQLAASSVPLVVAVSCNLNTFVRDAAILIEGGYRLQHLTPVDQFKWTPHVELVGIFMR